MKKSLLIAGFLTLSAAFLMIPEEASAHRAGYRTNYRGRHVQAHRRHVQAHRRHVRVVRNHYRHRVINRSVRHGWNPSYRRDLRHSSRVLNRRIHRARAYRGY